MSTSRFVSSVWPDRVGVLATATCTAHCVAMALLPALLPTLGLEFLHHEGVEWALLLLALGMAATAAVMGFRTHGSPLITAGFLLGAGLLLLARGAEMVGLPAMLPAIIGGVALVAAHLWNLSACRCEQCAS